MPDADRTAEVAPEIRVPVLIVGAGPAGLTASLALSRYGVRHLLVHKYPGTAHTPRAHLINQRTGEILRDLGVADRLREHAAPSELLANHVFMTTFAGFEIARLDAYGNGPARVGDYRAASPETMCNLPQHLLEPLLAQAVEEAGVGELRFGQEFRSLEQDEQGVTSVIVDRASGREYTVRSDYVIGADGARSRVLRQLGIDVEGPTGFAKAVSTWFEADLSRYAAHRPGILYMGTLPGDRVGDLRVFISIRPWNEWVFLSTDDPAAGFDPNDPEAMRDRIHESLGDSSVPITIKNISPWELSSAVAPRYSSGRVFCVGDAVHQNPPTNGLGLNTAVADSFNLCWKLRLVLAGQAGPELLETYHGERQPIGRQAVDRAFRSMLDLHGIPEALGFAEGQSAAEQWRLLGELTEESKEGEARRAALAAATERIEYQVNAHGVELGYRYGSGAMVPDETPEPDRDTDPELFYHPTTRPGARLPHAWLENGRRRCSTLDVTGRGRFVLLTGTEDGPWHEAAREAARRTGVEITVTRIGPGPGLRDPYGTWERVREVAADGAVLVRPDGHVAWRAATGEGAAALPAVMARVLCHPAADVPAGGTTPGTAAHPR
ncbi:FAD-dependent monooxygenase [Streptomyces sp. SAJ15]|uniref:FAD-dependent monooxygenase n=1 Tax=Streptomyces sp. SAJ15 TaxID=2011095 RepID=UPI001186F3FB|nr:FAD-dependent monooxygenase [Streptomyces sp. SAJ15]TVL91524.1 2,4-dichlorophenol 6-monooxygenase [Streptomyces sp. SAJ15]